MARYAFDYSKRFQLRVIDPEKEDILCCRMPTLVGAAMERPNHRVLGGHYYILDTLTGNSCSIRKARHHARGGEPINQAVPDL